MNQPDQAEPQFSGIQQQLLQLLSITPLQTIPAVQLQHSADKTSAAVPVQHAAAVLAAAQESGASSAASSQTGHPLSAEPVFQRADRQQVLVQDILQGLAWLDLPADWQVASQSDGSSVTFQPVEWRLQADALYTGPLTGLQSAAAKKALWQWLCQQAPATGEQEP